MKLSLGVVTAMQISESLALAEAAQNEGHHRIWVGEDIFHREIFTYLSVLALTTKGIGLASGITSPYVRNDQVIASSARGVAELSKGRLSLGIGVGGLPQVEKLIGERPEKPVETIEKTALFLKKQLGLKVFFGVRGPRMLELAGKIADGVILSGPQGYIEKAVEIVDKASSGRCIEKVLWNAFYLGENPKLVSKITSVMLESMPSFALQYMDQERAEDELCIYGSKNRIRDQIAAYEDMGIDELVVGPPYGDKPRTVIEEIGVL
jgi:alkanesulfonate monooxygenase SsuD/methylene tetrahydromethanopterin reductase-like flavin-dependent oxidoreductase (luciferase family)